MGQARSTLLALIAWSAGAAPTEPVVDRSMPGADVRSRADGALVGRDREAPPGLDRGQEDEDPEHRRAEQLAAFLATRRLRESTMVRLDFRDTPLPEVAESLGKQAGFPVVVVPGAALRGRSVTLQEAGPVPFWEAIGLLDASSGVRHDPGASYAFEVRDSVVVLGPAEGPPVPSSHSGPFRACLVHLARHRAVSPSRTADGGTAADSLDAMLQVFAEPGLAVSPIGPVVLDRAEDGRGRDRRPDPADGPAPVRRGVWLPRFEQGHAGAFAVSVPLDPGEGPGGSLRRLEGRVPLVAIARDGDPVVVLLGEGGSGAASLGGVSVGVAPIDGDDGDPKFTLTILGEHAELTRRPLLDVPPGPFRPPYRIEDHVQIQDAEGRSLWWNGGQVRDAGDGALEATVTVYGGQGGAPARVLYHGVIGASTEVTFAFADVPLP